jgi:hypothetical protein
LWFTYLRFQCVSGYSAYNDRIFSDQWTGKHKEVKDPG